ncbi:hypothetical protein ACGFNF_29435 [Micromonospora sp. NPDC048868]|uniref:hypothetical protein n=1 Tax=Micromonospora sp. NPDC048868 TaxID=3364258 RepID=UPI00371ADB56
MTTVEPPDVVTEKAVLQLLHLAFLEIRLYTAPVDDESLETLLKRREQINELADLCHGLPGCVASERRHLLGDNLRYLWRTSSARQQGWMRSRWDHLGYDHRWLTDPSTAGRADAAVVDADSGAVQSACNDLDPSGT